MREIYLDNNATTQVLPPVREEMLRTLEREFGNASSAHSAGDRARGHIIKARDSLARLLGSEASQLVFTSGGTESNNVVFYSTFQEADGNPRIVTSAIEHSSILKTCEYFAVQGAKIIYIPVTSDGFISLDELKRALEEEVHLVSIQWANNETGVIQPIEEIARLCSCRGVPFHTDAAQAVGKLELDLTVHQIDILTATAHKFHGPQGVGVLYCRNPRQLHPLFHGGPQERSKRPGTENLSGIVGMGAAAAIRHEKMSTTLEYVQHLRDHFERMILESVKGASINGDVHKRIANTTNIHFSEIDGEAMVFQLDLQGIRCSQSSACTNARPEPSYVLRAMGLSESEAHSSVRFSFSELNTMDEVDYAVSKILEIYGKLGGVRRYQRQEFSRSTSER